MRVIGHLLVLRKSSGGYCWPCARFNFRFFTTKNAIAASAIANKTPSGTPTYMPILLSLVEEDAAEDCDDCVGWASVVGRLDTEGL
jgi:hypothetical protein